MRANAIEIVKESKYLHHVSSAADSPFWRLTLKKKKKPRGTGHSHSLYCLRWATLRSQWGVAPEPWGYLRKSQAEPTYRQSSFVKKQHTQHLPFFYSHPPSLSFYKSNIYKLLGHKFWEVCEKWGLPVVGQRYNRCCCNWIETSFHLHWHCYAKNTCSWSNTEYFQKLPRLSQRNIKGWDSNWCTEL